MRFTNHPLRAPLAAVLAAAVVLAACGGDDASTTTTTVTATASSTTMAATTTSIGSSTSAPSTTAPPTSTTAAASTSPGTAAPGSSPRYPGADWERVDPASAGLDPAGLDRLAAMSEAAGSTCTVVVRDGVVVDERYWQGATADTTRQAFSVTKSVTSLLVGIAQGQGDLSIDDAAADYIPEWVGTPSADVTIRNLLSNDSGRHWDVSTDYREMAIAAPDKTAFAIGLGQDAPPGTVWAYNNSAVQTLSAVLQAATGQTPKDYAQQTIFDPIGMAHTTMGTDRAGNTTTFAGMESTCLDLARLGYLMLQGGNWEGQQIVPADYAAQATGQSSTDLNAAYGFLWWLNQEGPIVSPLIATNATEGPTVTDSQLLPGAPSDIFWALGFQQQMVAVIPSEAIVAVRMGPKPPDGVSFAQAEFTQGVLDAVVPGS
jgi:CubicO group peptidase (beta-lactamase class C family)